MGIEAWIVAGLIGAMLGALGFTRTPPDLIFIGALVLLLVGGILTPTQAFSGFSNQGMITVAALYVVVAGVRETGGIQWIVNSLLGQPKRLMSAQIRLTSPVALFSAFLNNTPVVGLLIPAVNEWAKKMEFPISRLMMPLSFAAILGGTITVIGTSTNLVVNGLLITTIGEGFNLFAIAWVGIPVALSGLAFMILFSHWLFPDRQPPSKEFDDPRQYTLEMIVEEGGPMIGKTIEDAGLRHLHGGYLMELERRGSVIPAVSPNEPLEADDRLIFVGVVESMAELQKLRGLKPSTEQVFKLKSRRSRRVLLEVVVSNTCPVVGRTIRDGRFRNRYNAVVIGVARNGHRIREKIGDIVLRAGDTLLVEAGHSFMAQNSNRRDFFLVSKVQDSVEPRHELAGVALLIMGGMVLSAAFGVLSMLEASLLAAALMVLFRCVGVTGARNSLEWPVLFTIAAAFGVAAAIETTGLAEAVAMGLIELAGESPWVNMVGIYLATALFTALITNNAAAVLMFPIAFAVSEDLSVSVLPFAVSIMFAASASFATPFGYQTNLMVYGPGGYRFSDYLRAGIPMTIVTAGIALFLIPRVWGWG